jgi:hypothetical protein
MRLARSIALGTLAGVAGTGVMTACQLAVAKLRGESAAPGVPRTWEDAPAPAKVVKKAAEAVGEGDRITKKDVPLVTNAVHWLYGITWGAVYGAAVGGRQVDPVAGGAVFGTGVWAAAYAELVPLGISEPPWRSPAKEVAIDLSYHLVYGLAVAGAYAALER